MFTIRVYGLLIRDGKVLVSDELIHGRKITKFPGGGLEFGEGALDCVKREFMEELTLPVEVVSHFYTTDFFVESAFSKGTQVMSIYYIVKTIGPGMIAATDMPHDYAHKVDKLSFRWIDLKEICEDDLTLIIDKKVADMLATSYQDKIN